MPEFAHPFSGLGPTGTGSTYQDWRKSMIEGLRANGLRSVMPDEDKVIGYEGLEV